jgi:ribosomal protein L37AE/L43A
MVSKQKINREKVMAALNTLCPKCGCLIPPEKIRRIDSSLVECPSCGERFTPGTGRGDLRATPND